MDTFFDLYFDFQLKCSLASMARGRNCMRSSVKFQTFYYNDQPKM